VCEAFLVQVHGPHHVVVEIFRRGALQGWSSRDSRDETRVKSVKKGIGILKMLKKERKNTENVKRKYKNAT
jgi:hypothetical protein